MVQFARCALLCVWFIHFNHWHFCALVGQTPGSFATNPSNVQHSYKSDRKLWHLQNFTPIRFMENGAQNLTSLNANSDVERYFYAALKGINIEKYRRTLPHTACQTILILNFFFFVFYSSNYETKQLMYGIMNIDCWNGIYRYFVCVRNGCGLDPCQSVPATLIPQQNVLMLHCWWKIVSLRFWTLWWPFTVWKWQGNGEKLV